MYEIRPCCYICMHVRLAIFYISVLHEGKLYTMREQLDKENSRSKGWRDGE